MEIKECNLEETRNCNRDFRIDSGFYTKQIPKNEKLIYKKEKELAEIVAQRAQMESIIKEQAEYRQHEKQIYIFAGKIEQALANINQSSDDRLIKKQNDLMERIKEIKIDLEPTRIRLRIEKAIISISSLMEKYASRLKLEHAHEGVRLNIKDLTVEFKNATGRTDYLWEVGSGQNWVGYHIATLLAIHEYINSFAECPVPSFILMDQPSQVYFPESSWTNISDSPKSLDGRDLSADIMGVQRIFSVISEFLESQKEKMQIIITEHAGEIAWENIKNVHVVGNWRQGEDEFLIPHNWLLPSESKIPNA